MFWLSRGVLMPQWFTRFAMDGWYLTMCFDLDTTLRERNAQTT
jgi:hypothetical protein